MLPARYCFFTLSIEDAQHAFQRRCLPDDYLLSPTPPPSPYAAATSRFLPCSRRCQQREDAARLPLLDISTLMLARPSAATRLYVVTAFIFAARAYAEIT